MESKNQPLNRLSCRRYETWSTSFSNVSWNLFTRKILSELKPHLYKTQHNSLQEAFRVYCLNIASDLYLCKTIKTICCRNDLKQLKSVTVKKNRQIRAHEYTLRACPIKAISSLGIHKYYRYYQKRKD